VTDDDSTQFWEFDPDPEATVELRGSQSPPGVPGGSPPPAPGGFDEGATMVGVPSVRDDRDTRVVATPDPTVRYSESQRNWLESAPIAPVDQPVYRARPPRARKRAVWPRIVAPVVFLIAVVAFFAILVDAGVVGGKDDVKKDKVAPASTAKAKPKYYKVKPGDSMSVIAVKLGVSVQALEDANPNASITTLTPGEKLKIPSD
jgi:LysM repeat protein